jgi:hypothetical protein
MAESSNSKNAGDGSNGGQGVAAYSRAQPPDTRAICEQLRELIDAALPRASSKVWHGGPVWFVGENPVVGYDATQKGVRLLFWNGQAFDEPGLEPVGKHRAAHAVFAHAAEIDAKLVRRWLKKAGTDVFDSKAFFAIQRRGAR